MLDVWKNFTSYRGDKEDGGGMCVCVGGDERRSCGESKRDSGGVEGNSGPSDHAVLRFRSKVEDPALQSTDRHHSQWTARTPGPSPGGRVLPMAALGWERRPRF